MVPAGNKAKRLILVNHKQYLRKSMHQATNTFSRNLTTNYRIRIFILILFFSAQFFLLGDGEESPPTSQTFAHPLPPKSQSPQLNNSFQVTTQQKQHFQLQSMLLFHFYFNFILMLILISIDVQHSQKAGFRFEKDSNHQNHSPSVSLHPVKIFDPV